MAEGTYEYECMRAELLGVEKPNYEDFMRKKQEQASAVEEEEKDIENLKEVEHDDEQTRHISGGLDELNSILQVTQRKINRFKATCGSFTSLLKFKISGSSSTESVENGVKNETDDVPSTARADEAEPVLNNSNGTCSNGRQSDLAKALDNHTDRLDSLIDKAENAQYSMSHQTKEMKRFLK